MSTPQLPLSSSPPTTPLPKWRPSEINAASSMSSNMPNDLSTTPAGPPPHSTASFTPAGPPPPSAFGSSPFGTEVSKVRSVKQKHLPDLRRDLSWQAQRTKNGMPEDILADNTFNVPSNSVFSEASLLDHSAVHPPKSKNRGLYEHGYDDSMREYGGSSPLTGNEARSKLPLSSNQYPFSIRSQYQQTAPIQRTSVMSHNLPRRGNPDIIPNVARDLACRSQPAALLEPDEMILETEEILIKLYQGITTVPGKEISSVFASLALMRLWNACAPPEHNLGEGIGPGPGASPLQKGTYLASLLLPLRHPPFLSSAGTGLKDQMGSGPSTARPQPMPTPKVLIDWLNRYHLSYTDLFDAVRSARPNCTAHEQFWDVAFGMLVRGQTSYVMQLFADTDFQHAVSAMDEGREEPGYHGAQLQAVQAAVVRAGEVLRVCPATRGEWQIDSSDWDLFRNRASSELEHIVASGRPSAHEDTTPSFQAENFGLQKPGRLLPRSANPTEGKLPWTIHHNLKIFYGILLGNADEIIAQSQDWLEATAALTIWWDGSEEMGITRWSLNASQAQRVDDSLDSGDPYLARLRAAFLCVTDPESDDSFQINPQSHVEVGLASILQGNIEGVLSSLRTCSLLITAAVTEVASIAGWLKPLQPRNVPALDRDDMSVLQYGTLSQGITRDGILVQYAEELFSRHQFVDDEDSCEGWELAIAVASRVHDRQLATDTTTKFLNQLDLDSQDRLDKLLALCSSLGLESEARKVSERFADHLSASTTLYGSALICYARSHAAAKIRQLVDFLVSYSLVRSAAYPPHAELDDDLRILVENPRRPLAKLHQFDPEGAAMLQFYTAGYACLRRFYHLRDEGISVKGVKAEDRTQKAPSNMNLVARRRAAAKALVAVINSSADSIYGGLYDAERESAIQVDGLLTLLGEVTVLVAEQQHSQQGGISNMNKRVLTSTQVYDILSAIEDIQTVNRRVYNAAEDCLVAALRSYNDPSAIPSAHSLKKSVCGGGGSNSSTGNGGNSNFSFSMVGSELLNSTVTSSGGTRSAGAEAGSGVGGSGVLVNTNEEHDEQDDDDDDDKGGKVERGWDWRARFAKITTDLSAATSTSMSAVGGGLDRSTSNNNATGAGDQILLFLRRTLARELPFAELSDEQEQRQQRQRLIRR